MDTNRLLEKQEGMQTLGLLHAGGPDLLNVGSVRESGRTKSQLTANEHGKWAWIVVEVSQDQPQKRYPFHLSQAVLVLSLSSSIERLTTLQFPQCQVSFMHRSNDCSCYNHFDSVRAFCCLDMTVD